VSADSSIEWTDHTFNPWWGCARVSPGCYHCYAEAFDHRLGGEHWGPKAERRFFGETHWREPLKWNRAAGKAGERRRVFCASMADVFEDRRDLDGERDRLFGLIGLTPHLDWQLLTKRPENMMRLAPAIWTQAWPANVWAGCTVEDQQRADERIPHLLRVPAAVRFLSVEPQLGAVDVSGYTGRAAKLCHACGLKYGHDAAVGGTGCRGVDWVIVGGESGHGARVFNVDWARQIVAQCKAASVACFVKQLGAVAMEDTQELGRRYKVGNVLAMANKKGGDPSEWPSDLRVREFPR
jgi:protein gp37